MRSGYFSRAMETHQADPTLKTIHLNMEDLNPLSLLINN